MYVRTYVHNYVCMYICILQSASQDLEVLFGVCLFLRSAMAQDKPVITDTLQCVLQALHGMYVHTCTYVFIYPVHMYVRTYILHKYIRVIEK